MYHIMNRTQFGKDLPVNSSLDMVGDGIASSMEMYRMAVILWKYCAPVILVVGTVGSVVSLLVLCQPSMRKQTTMYYLAVLGVGDIMVLYAGLLRLWLEKAFDFYIRLQSDWACRLHTFGVYVSLDFSVWILVAVSIDRCLFISLPYAARRWCTLKRARLAVAMMALCMAVVNVHFLWTYRREVDDDSMGITGNDKYRCYVNSDSRVSQRFIKSVWPWVDFCVYCMTPFVVMLGTNIIIARHLIGSNRRLAAHRHGTLASTSANSPKNDQTTAKAFNLSGSVSPQRDQLAEPPSSGRRPEAEKRLNAIVPRVKSVLRRKKNVVENGARCENKSNADTTGNHDAKQRETESSSPSGVVQLSQDNSPKTTIAHNMIVSSTTRCNTRQSKGDEAVQMDANVFRSDQETSAAPETIVAENKSRTHMPGNGRKKKPGFLPERRKERFMGAKTRLKNALGCQRGTKVSCDETKECPLRMSSSDTLELESIVTSSDACIAGEIVMVEEGGKNTQSHGKRHQVRANNKVHPEHSFDKLTPDQTNTRSSSDRNCVRRDGQLLFCLSLTGARIPSDARIHHGHADLDHCGNCQHARDSQQEVRLSKNSQMDAQFTINGQTKDQFVTEADNQPLGHVSTESHVKARVATNTQLSTRIAKDQASTTNQTSSLLPTVSPPRNGYSQRGVSLSPKQCLKRSKPAGRDALKKTVLSQHSRRINTAAISTTLLSINVLFWILNAPIMIYIIGFTYWVKDADGHTIAKLELAWAVVNILQYTNNAAHLFLYCLTGPRFRKELWHLVQRLVSTN